MMDYILYIDTSYTIFSGKKVNDRIAKIISQQNNFAELYHSTQNNISV